MSLANMIDLDCLDGIDIITDPSIIRSSTEPDQQNSQAKLVFSTPMSNEGANLLTCMLITANVGTIFEESILLELWFQQLKSYLIKVKPQIVAIHCQEVGGKNYESSMKHVSSFTDKILGDEAVIGDYARVRIFLDENFESLEKFTALGSLYLIHDSVPDVKLYNFKTAQYESVEGRQVSPAVSAAKGAEHVEKVKFPQELFPECRWSRKGYMRTRWLFNDSQPLDLVNIHLFHDASNLVAMRETPSPYAQNRQRALEFTLQKISEPLEGNLEQSQHKQKLEQTAQIPLFMFGDFNFRLDTSQVIHRITGGVSPVVKRNADSNEVLEVVYHRRADCEQTSEQANSPSKGELNSLKTKGRDDGNSNYIEGAGVVMTIGKKLFDCENLDETFRATKNTEWLQELDKELDSFKSQLYEFKISFSPSYPFMEDTTGGYSYMKTRCPAWCDRILFNAAGGRIIHGKRLPAGVDLSDSEKRIELLQEGDNILYRSMGDSVPMGDHKPVLLYCQLNLSSTTNERQRQQQACQKESSCDAVRAEPERMVGSTAI